MSVHGASAQEMFSGTKEVAETHKFNEDNLFQWMTENVEGFEGPMDVRQFKGGQSNPTFKIITPKKAYVMRRKPPGQLLKGAHAIEREYRVIRALGAAGFPVAKAYALCEDADVIGTAFYVMDMVEGRIFWDSTLPGLDPADRARHFDAMNATIAQLHAIDPVAAVLRGPVFDVSFRRSMVFMFPRFWHHWSYRSIFTN